MKKNIFIALSLTASVFLFAKPKLKFDVDYDAPDLSAENSYLIDLYEFGTQGVSSVKIVFYANNPNKINILGNNPENKEWISLVQTELKGFSDQDTESFKNKESMSWRYFALIPENNVFYQYKIGVSGKTLKVEVRSRNDSFDEKPMPKINIENAVVLDIKKYDAEDYVVFKNYTSQPELKIIPYYFNHYKWSRAFESAVLAGFSDEKKIEIINDEGIEDVRYLALDIQPQSDYHFKLYENHNDLYIEITDVEGNAKEPSEEKNINLIDE